LEKENPGITSVKRTSSNAVLVDDDLDNDLDTLITQINQHYKTESG